MPKAKLSPASIRRLIGQHSAVVNDDRTSKVQTPSKLTGGSSIMATVRHTIIKQWYRNNTPFNVTNEMLNTTACCEQLQHTYMSFFRFHPGQSFKAALMLMLNCLGPDVGQLQKQSLRNCWCFFGPGPVSVNCSEGPYPGEGFRFVLLLNRQPRCYMAALQLFSAIANDQYSCMGPQIVLHDRTRCYGVERNGLTRRAS
jgi:hypothetical protein